MYTTFNVSSLSNYRLLNDTEIAKAQRDFEIKKAAYDVEVRTKVNISEYIYYFNVCSCFMQTPTFSGFSLEYLLIFHNKSEIFQV